MSPLGGAVTMDVDGKGKIWASAPDGVLRFDPVTETFTDFKSATPFKNARGTNSTYGAAGDRDGNGWWAQMAIDTIGKADVTTGKTSEVALPLLKDEMDRLTPAQKTFYDNFDNVTNGNPLPWSEGPRRMGTDKNADVLWVGNSWGSSLARINTKTMETTIIPFPDKTMQAYHLVVDQNHNVWGNLWTSDRIVKLRSGHQQVHHVRPAGARHRNPPHLAHGARWQDPGDRADLPGEPDGRHDAAQRGRIGRPQGAGEVTRRSKRAARSGGALRSRGRVHAPGGAGPARRFFGRCDRPRLYGPPSMRASHISSKRGPPQRIRASA